MGLPMTRHLIGKGYAVRGFDIVAERLRRAQEAGAAVASNAADTVRDADLILLNLPTTDAVEDAVFGSGGLAAAMQAGADRRRFPRRSRWRRAGASPSGF